jgi:hypothetical protein
MQRSPESNPRQLHSGATAVQLTLCSKYLATAPQTPPFTSTLGSLAPDRGNGRELTAAPISSLPSPTSDGWNRNYRLTWPQYFTFWLLLSVLTVPKKFVIVNFLLYTDAAVFWFPDWKQRIEPAFILFPFLTIRDKLALFMVMLVCIFTTCYVSS